MLILTKTESACIPVERVDRKVVYPFHHRFLLTMKRTTVEIASASPGRPPLRCRVLAEPADAAQLQQLESEGCTTHLAAANSGDIFDDVDVPLEVGLTLHCGALVLRREARPAFPSLHLWQM